jgi:hypothetical protein
MHAGRDSLFDQLPLELSHGANDLHHQTAGWGGEVEVVSQGYEGHTVSARVLDRRDQVLELPADDRIEGSRVGGCEHTVQLWARLPGPAYAQVDVLGGDFPAAAKSAMCRHSHEHDLDRNILSKRPCARRAYVTKEPIYFGDDSCCDTS